MQCSDSSKTGICLFLKTLIKAKGERLITISTVIFARLLAASSNVESANIPQEMAVQIVKDISCEKFKIYVTG
ncbi:hypothetical protein CEXT_478931, partial [Caerostris extrusa]